MTARVYRAEDCDTTHHTGCACHEARRDARERELTEALRALCDALRYAHWCTRCGARWSTQHVDDCPIGRALRVLDGGAR